ncbi:methylated-DNA--[protein]-cysteine S-methyltransferase [Paraburkholderia sp. DHOC27]|uniref:methylated-DNA--[protein]-cysteine S-methyltransferase n=1 Tax=Paraburkholderia sp. DHOC27 TaxID=2303330 RepID=UPI000E3E0550|nr:methylated-DNA--[protein]-cysteine S-methyltransferase [Paraburkholderia sp. DHOC27]RFU48708.1 methylated-DNA--[protein]-cysteine S-methyltransferase [Paraburkholderia sp. DHOC27]
MNQYLFIPSPLGAILLRAEDDALTGLYFDGQKYFPRGAVDTAGGKPPRVLEETAQQIAEYFAGERQDFTVRLRMAGSTFQQQVWNALIQIPFGEIESYGRLAQRLGLPVGSARAVGAANGRNPVAIIVPCHRVIGVAGDLTGYAGGVERKAALLTLERPARSFPRQLDLLDTIQ